MRAVREDGGRGRQSSGRPRKIFEENQKKGLTNGSESGILCKLSARTTGNCRVSGGSEKKFEKTLKKGLTNSPEPAILPIVPLVRRVPCKLNNVTKRKHHTNTVLWNFDEGSRKADF